MFTQSLGKTDIRVNAIGMGAMPLSLAGHPDAETAFDVIKNFIEAGGDFIDTANVYCPSINAMGHNERLIAKALKQLEINDKIKIATKGGLRRLNGSWAADASPMWLRISCENSLTELAVQSIFLYQLHSPDPDIPFAESMGELVRLKQDGLIQHIGLCNVGRKQIEQAMQYTEVLSVQNRCSVLQKTDLNNGTVEFCRQHNISYICHSPVGGHYQHQQAMTQDDLQDIAKRHGTSAYVIALAWLIQHPANLLTIPGASKPRTVQSSMLAHDIQFNEDEIQRLNAL